MLTGLIDLKTSKEQQQNNYIQGLDTTDNDDKGGHSLTTSALLYTQQKYGATGFQGLTATKSEVNIELQNQSISNQAVYVANNHDSIKYPQINVNSEVGGPVSFAPNNE